MDCILHIGTEKTGTTTLQNFLYDNVDALAAQGVALSQVMQTPNNRDFVAYFRHKLDDFAQMAGFYNQQEKARFFDGFEQRVVDEIQQLKTHCTTMVITSEHFHSRLIEPADIKTLQAFLKSHFDTVKVVCYLREQSSLRRSLYSTALKAEVDAPLEMFHPKIGAGHYYYDFEVVLNRWRRVFGAENMLPRLFCKSQLVEGDICKDFVASALPFVTSDALAFNQPDDNKSLKPLQARAFQAINRNRPFIQPAGGLDPVNLGLKEAVMQVPGLDRGTIESPLNSKISERFQRSNQAVSQQYFDGKPLFDVPSPKNDVTAEERFSLDEVGDIIENMMDQVLAKYAGKIVNEQEIDLLRDCAQRTNDGLPLTNEQAVKLLEIARRARPNGPVIKDMLRALRKRQN